ncbi:MAG: hypothetical protein WD431_18520 [Cyclobacteriaceae bacterium]
MAQQRDYTFKNVTIRQGLSPNSVVAVEEDETGFIWFATKGGLNRFDGKDMLFNLKPTGIPHDFVDFLKFSLNNGQTMVF